jgi:hypothetical protein
MPISTIGQNGLNAPITLTSPVINTVTSAAATALTLQSAGTTAVTIDTSQNVGVGTTSPSTYGKLVSYAGDIAAVKAHGSGSYPTLVLQNATAGTTFSGRVLWKDGNGNAGWNVGNNVVVGSGYLEFNNGSTNEMCLDPSGNLLVGCTSNSGLQTATAGGFATDGVNYLWVTRSAPGGATVDIGRTGAAGTGGYLEWWYNGTITGTVSTGGSTTTYGTSSDYRLKENIAPMTGALAKVAQLKPCTYKWKVDGSDGQGFIAHELQAVVPDCVTGEKDAVETYLDDEGNEQTRIKPQGIDTSFLVATLTAAIQELKAEVDALKAKVA